jgi:hypothetical protein
MPHTLAVDFEKWVAIFSKMNVGEPLSVDKREVSDAELGEILSAAGLVESLMGHVFDWKLTNYQQLTFRRTR